jgi:hypothetical protein
VGRELLQVCEENGEMIHLKKMHELEGLGMVDMFCSTVTFYICSSTPFGGRYKATVFA